MKKVFSIYFSLLLSVVIFLNVDIVNAMEDTNEEQSTVFYDFLQRAANNQIEVVYSSNSISSSQSSKDVVPSKISNQVKSKLFTKDFESVFYLLDEYNLSLQFIENSAPLYDNSIGTFSVGSTVNNRTVHVYHLQYDKAKKFKKEWITSLTISYRENSNGTFTALSNPSMNVSANFGAAFNEEVSNVSTGYRYTTGNKGIDFYASYNLRARVVIPIEVAGIEIPIGRWFDWGTIRANYSLR